MISDQSLSLPKPQQFVHSAQDASRGASAGEASLGGTCGHMCAFPKFSRCAWQCVA